MFNLQIDTEAKSVTRTVSKIKIHTGYSEVTTDYDIALIKLDSPVSIVPDQITPVCLPNIGDDFTGAKATVAGMYSSAGDHRTRNPTGQ